MWSFIINFAKFPGRLYMISWQGFSSGEAGPLL
jgi:hypothetical protein